MSDPTQRSAFIAVGIRLMADDNDTALPDPATDFIGIELDGITRGSPFTTEQSNEATGSLVSGAAQVIGQAASFAFTSRIRGAGPGVVYTSTVKPPLHAALSACGKRAQFQAAVAAAALTAGSATSATLANGAPATAGALVGMPLILSGGTANNGRLPMVTGYSAGRVATLSETFDTPLTTGESAAIPANWTYSGTTPADATAKATDQPLAVIAFYRDGVLFKYTHCRGVVNLNGRSARPGFAAFSFAGIFAGKTDAAVPSLAALKQHAPPNLARGTDASNVAIFNRKPVSISTWSFNDGANVTSSEDPNTNIGFGAGEIGQRTPVLTIDPLATLVANRDVLAQISTGALVPASFRYGTQAGNRWALTIPVAQVTGESDTQRDNLVGEQITAQAISQGKDAYLRDTDSILCFY
ncbi:hypothetical protein CA233_19180 [Sphingomonas sp. ABOLD]|uniref:Uncharacterized protein n=1 Tax=Sphingomonas trueperi TaxID=53317 RepID=A0A7X5Y2U6_9SPHN|nr:MULTISPECIES: hypothetical protein [Sphingomonas]NJB99432.1 hypothetical protein [Sphingomonas trueperi]RSV35182.1 hypothetical protein CA234_20330 [Sphingomonas sp. ABOLE]RSV40963.1 hypothetical protein CA233_19180 [Sphingomonas sp. ABOLD]